MESKKRPKMPVENRAKQFMPFSALKGYEEALKEVDKALDEENNIENECTEDGFNG